ncbi:unnamed protein product, partial [marine sediment metagenome]
ITKKKELLKDLFDLRKENIKSIRSHLYHMLLLSGAIAAFLMPVYASGNLSEIQKLLIPWSISSLLLAIIIGIFHLSQVLRDENRWLSDMNLAAENHDTEAYKRYKTRSDASKREKKRAGFYSYLVEILFILGCILLIAALILKQFDL